MSCLSIFDIVGPIMVGPSSSHTAGAARIGRIVRGVIRQEPTSITLRFPFALMQTYHGHRTDSALVGGILGLREDDAQLRDSLSLARSRGIPVAVEQLNVPDAHPNTMSCCVTSVSGMHEVTAVSVGGGSIVVTKVQDCPTEIRGDSFELLISLDHRQGASPSEAAIHSIIRRAGLDIVKQDHGANMLWFSLTAKPDEDLVLCIAALDGVLDALVIEPLSGFANRNPLFVPGFNTLADLVTCSETRSIAEALAEHEANRSGLSPGSVRDEMARNLQVMYESVAEGLSGECKPLAGFIPGDDGHRLFERHLAGSTLSGGILPAAIARSLAVGELNSAMGRIVAAPTAGSSGVLPAVLLSVGEKLGLSDDVLLDALFVAAGVGLVIANTASFSGAVGGCQGEVGSASAMAASAAVYAYGGSMLEAAHAAALALKNILGLVCDPVAAPVEVPCVKRNAIGVANALAAAEMSLAGIRGAIPPDEVISALKNVQSLLHEDLRDNTRGGLGSTPTAARLKAEWARRLSCHACYR